MRRAWALVLSGTVVLGAFSAFMSAATAAQSPPKPTIELSPQTLEPGKTVTITGAHWPEGSTLQASLCGNRALDGSANCVQDTAVTMTPGPDGAILDALQVTMPPAPCPCVIFVNLLASNLQLRLPVQVVGAPFAPAMRHAPPKITKSISAEASVESTSSSGALFGGGAGRTLVLELHNKANVAIHRVLVVATWGKNERDHPIPSKLVLLPAHRTVTVRLPFELDPLALGGYEVRGAAGVAGNRVGFATHTSQWPWGLIAVLVLVVLGILVLVLRAIRRRGGADGVGPSSPETLEPVSWGPVDSDPVGVTSGGPSTSP